MIVGYDVYIEFVNNRLDMPIIVSKAASFINKESALQAAIEFLTDEGFIDGYNKPDFLDLLIDFPVIDENENITKQGYVPLLYDFHFV